MSRTRRFQEFIKVAHAQIVIHFLIPIAAKLHLERMYKSDLMDRCKITLR